MPDLATLKYVYDFSEGNKDLKALLGGKGANLAEMTNLGLPVPPGFTITTEACREYLATGHEPDSLAGEVAHHLAALERRMGRRLGEPDDPLLVSVRSGAAFSMPGMMETVLNVGLTDESVHGLARQTGSERFAWDSYRRLLHMFGTTVLRVDGRLFHSTLDEAKQSRGVSADTGLDAADLRAIVEQYKKIIETEVGAPFPQDPREQLSRAIRAVFESWMAPRAVLYRRQEHIPPDLGTAVTVMAMVFGNLGEDSGTGVAFTRDPATGTPGLYGDYLQNAQGEDVVAGIRNTISLAELERIDAASYRELLQIMQQLEQHYRDLCDIEFTVERGKLWMLQTRVGKRTAAAAFRIATQLVDEGLIDPDEALLRVTGEQLSHLMFPRFDERAEAVRLGRGIAASPGAAVGRAVFDSETAVKRARSGEDVILVRRETNPDDLDGMIAARGVLTSRGGKTSHAAVVARGMGKTCVCGAEMLNVDTRERRLTVPTDDGTEVVVAEGDVISIDGSRGWVFLGEVPVVASPVVDYFERADRPDAIDERSGGAAGATAAADDAEAAEARDVVAAVDRLIRHADAVRRMGVRTNADTPEDAARARRFGAEGIGLCRTEHMFLGERRLFVERLILAATDSEREQALAELMPLQREDFVGIFEAMDGLPVTIRLLDPPLHEFLPDLTDLAVRVAVAEAHHEEHEGALRLLQAVRRLHEQNPMFGMRGVRLGIMTPGLFAMQVRAILTAAAQHQKAGGRPLVEIMIPLVDAVQEVELVRREAEAVAREVIEESGVRLDYKIGTMIELPRACLTAGEIATEAQFFSFGTNDLTQTTWGFSRDDVESAFFSAYLEKSIFEVSPFESIDTDGVGRLVDFACREGRRTRPDLKLGVCGEHGGDPQSVHFFHDIGLDYVSCSPFRLPVARLEAGRAAVQRPGESGPASDTR